MNIEKIISADLVSFVFRNKMRMSIAEASFIDSDLALSYLKLADNDYTYLLKNNKCLFFNRLNVCPHDRNTGIGTVLLKELITFCAEHNYLLINTINNYGEMSDLELMSFYEKNGFKLIHNDGLLIYHHELCNFHSLSLT